MVIKDAGMMTGTVAIIRIFNLLQKCGDGAEGFPASPEWFWPHPSAPYILLRTTPAVQPHFLGSR